MLLQQHQKLLLKSGFPMMLLLALNNWKQQLPQDIIEFRRPCGTCATQNAGPALETPCWFRSFPGTWQAASRIQRAMPSQTQTTLKSQIFRVTNLAGGLLESASW